jgi:biopolymer transport protein ExbD
LDREKAERGKKKVRAFTACPEMPVVSFIGVIVFLLMLFKFTAFFFPHLLPVLPLPP